MDWLEEELKQALSRKEPSEAFDARVAAVAQRRPKLVMMPRKWMAAAAAVLVMLIGGGEGYREYRGQMAKQQVMLAMRIAGGKLSQVQSQMGNR